MKRRSDGFTLIEMIFTITVAMVLLAAAVPSFFNVIRDNTVTTETNRLIADIQLARSEAMKRGARVALCRTADPKAETPSCGGTANTWTGGWLVFVDQNRSGSYEDGTDRLVKAGMPARGNGLTVRPNAASSTRLVFNPDATLNGDGSTAIFALCDKRGSTHGKQINIPPVGRPRLASSVSSCETPSNTVSATG